ncbi:hypothetical protein [Halotia branconii]|uniref:Uncharacterized protein n=1 Tax=Halotia branconii CENA392 TaxID=1539056 RepID=A0AAJ6NTM0_9CYAN|nr:hypothetical protein [Halotia branconii]WGV26318.1 hypothetical protein QI031_02045 [Halotia branconii CENA392]
MNQVLNKYNVAIVADDSLLTKVSNQKFMQHKVKVLLALIPFSFILGSCQKEDLSAAKSFGDLSQSLVVANKTISADIYASCARSATLEALGTTENRINSQNQLNVCNDIYLPNSKNTERAGSVLVNYVAAIGNLATGNDNDFTPQFQTISESLGNLPINENARTAGIKIADFITNLLIKDFRRDNLKVAIVCTDQDIQEYSAQLSDFIESSYVKNLLDREIMQIHENYGYYIGEVNKRTKLSNSEDNLQDFSALQERQTLLEAEERAEITKVIERKKQGADYVTAIRDTAEFHGKLKRIFNKNREKLSSAQIQKCNKYHSNNANLSVQNTQQKDELWNQKITTSELKEAKKVTKEYIDKITPLLERNQD